MKSSIYSILCVILIPCFLSVDAYGENPEKIRDFTRASDQKTMQASVFAHNGEKVTLQVVGKKRYTLDPAIFIEADQKYLQDWLWRSRGIPLPSELDPRIKPGATFRVEMPDLANTFTGKSAGFTVSIPTIFNYPDPLPLLVFLNGGSGNESLAAAKSIADAKRYVLVSFPFTSEIKKDGALGHVKSNMKLIEAYHEAMLERLKTLIPNLSQTHRVVAGSSNGAHIVGSAIAMDWDCYLDFFRAFIVWEGGGSLSKNFKAAKGKRYCSWVGWGAKSTSKDFAVGIAEAMDDSRMRITKEEVKTAGHGMNKDAQMAIRSWLSEVAEPTLDKMASPKAKR